MKPHIAFLAGLDGETAAAITKRLEPVAIAGGRVLFEQGEEADGLYALASGSIGISIRDERSGTTRRVARLQPPDTVGEVALLSAVPRSATAVALRDSQLFRLTRAAFAEVVDQNPAILRYLARLLSDRLRGADKTPHLKHASTTLAVIAVTEGSDTPVFSETLRMSFDGAAPRRHGKLIAWPQGADQAWFHAFEAGHARTIYAADLPGSPWSHLCLRRADHVLLLAEPGRPLLSGVVDLLAQHGSDWVRRDLVILQDGDAAAPRALAKDVEALSVDMRIQVRRDRPEDMSRLARLASGTARGLVLGGGGARGFAHLGVLRALKEAGVAVDFVGGTSMGAIVAASLAMGWDLDAVHERIIESFVRQNPLDDYTLPVLALTRGAKVDSGLDRHFGAARIEDLWLSFFCISANLSTGTATIHRSGDLATALRASIAIPGLMPPVCTKDGVLVDGGMINNLPADVMAAEERGTVLAVDVGSDLAFAANPKRGWRSRTVRRLLNVPDAAPGIAQLLFRAATISTDAHSAAALDHADAVLKPPLAEFDLRAWSSYEAIAEAGYRHAKAAIAERRLDGWIGSQDAESAGRWGVAA